MKQKIGTESSLVRSYAYYPEWKPPIFTQNSYGLFSQVAQSSNCRDSTPIKFHTASYTNVQKSNPLANPLYISGNLKFNFSTYQYDKVRNQVPWHHVRWILNRVPLSRVFAFQKTSKANFAIPSRNRIGVDFLWGVLRPFSTWNVSCET